MNRSRPNAGTVLWEANPFADRMRTSSAKGFASHKSARRGITLLEILVSIFILVVGLLGTAALIPIGNSEATKGQIAHRGAEVGVRAYHEFRVRRMNDPRNWISGGQACTQPTGGGSGGGNHALKESFRNKAICIDAWAAAVGAQSFPYNTTGGLPMLIVSLRSTPFASDEAVSSGGGMEAPFAREIFSSRDTLLFERPDDTLKPPQQKMDNTRSRRFSETVYTWLATLIPQESDPETYLASFAVFARNHPIRDQVPVRDEMVTTAQWMGGTDFRISAPQGPDRKRMREMLRVGRWLLLSGQSQQYKWYRVTAIEGQLDDEGGMRQVTLEGPDWSQSWGTSPMVAMYGGGGVVAVYERTVQLEWDTLWIRGTRKVDEQQVQQ
jgi:hypothetical protein